MFSVQENPVLSLEVQAVMTQADQAERSQVSLLVRHFLDRFFNHEMVSSDGDAKARLIQVACAAGLPGFVMALYLWAPYHPLIGNPPPYWARVSHHFFYVMYSMVVMGIIMVFEWDLFFPDLLDIFVLSSLPIHHQRLFLARIAAITIFIVGFLFDANFLALMVLPAAIDPPSIGRFLAAHLLAVAASGIFAAALILALQGVLLSVFGERFFRRIAPLLQGLSVTALLMLLFLFPVLSGVLPTFMRSGSAYAWYFPPFWFLGMYQRVMEGPSALPIFAKLAQTGCEATLLAIAVAAFFYPIAYWRRTRQLIEGLRTRDEQSWVAGPIHRMLHGTMLQLPVRRAIFHFITQTLLRVQRYRIYLVVSGGVAFSFVAAILLRLHVRYGHVHIDVSSDGIRAAIPIMAFWTIAGLRMAFVSPGNQQGGWIFRTTQGKPTLDQLLAAKIWVFVWGLLVTLGVAVALRAISPPELRGLRATASQVLVAAGLCLLLTDIFFLRVKIIPFTGSQAAVKPNLAIVLMKYFAFFPLAVLLPLSCGPWVEASIAHMVAAVLLIIGAHLGLRTIHQRIVKEYLNLLDLDDEDEGVLLGLWLHR
jgi:hypothetical protein